MRIRICKSEELACWLGYLKIAYGSSVEGGVITNTQTIRESQLVSPKMGKKKTKGKKDEGKLGKTFWGKKTIEMVRKLGAKDWISKE